MGKFNRDFFFEKSAACTNDLTTCKAICFHDMAGMFIRIPSGSSISLYKIYVSGEENGDYSLAIDESKNNIEDLAVVADRAYRVNPAVFPALWCKVLTDQAAGVADIFGKA